MGAEKILFTPVLMHFAARHIGKSYGEFASDYRVLAEANLRCMEFFHTDMAWLISDPYRETSALGAGIEFIPEGVPRCLNNIVHSIQDVRKLEIPDVYHAERTSDRLKAAETISSTLGGKKSLIGWVEGQLAEACDLAGLDTMLLQLLTDPEFSDELLDKCTAMAKTFAEAQIRAGCDIIGVGDAICSQIDLQLYEQYVENRHRELFDFIHDLGGIVKLHICGDITHLLSSIAREGADIVDLDWQVDMKAAHQILGKDCILCGNINPLNVMRNSAMEVEQECTNLIKKMQGIPFILSAGCEIPVSTPPENLLAMHFARLKSY
ncbi:MAG: uroporphyrinogen decarboxylase family protein [Bacteroidales bacterium]